MAEVVHDAHQEFWRSPTVLEPLAGTVLPAAGLDVAEACADCGTEFMIGARFCHTCGLRRPRQAQADNDDDNDNRATVMASLWARSVARLGAGAASVSASWRGISFPAWLQYLHFHEIKRWVGLPTAALIAFIIGVGYVVGAVGVSL